MPVPEVLADKDSAVPSKRLVIVTFRERTSPSTSTTVASVSAMFTAPPSSVKVFSKLESPPAPSRSTTGASLPPCTSNVAVSVAVEYAVIPPFVETSTPVSPVELVV